MLAMLRNVSTICFATTYLAACAADGEGPEPGTGEVPAGLLDVEGQAEDAYDKALARDFATVATVAASIDASWQAFRARAVTDGAAAGDLDAMDAAIVGLQDAASTSTDPATVARAANAISAPMDELFALYDPTVPTDILALDYLGREVVLDGMDADLSSAAGDVATIGATWGRVRAAVLDAGGNAEAADYDTSVAALRADIAAQDETMIINDAKVSLEIVDAIEGVFVP